MFKLQRKFAFLAVPAVLAIGAVSYGSVVAMAAPSHSQAVVKAPSAAEPAESASDTTPDLDTIQSGPQQEGTP